MNDLGPITLEIKDNIIEDKYNFNKHLNKERERQKHVTHIWKETKKQKEYDLKIQQQNDKRQKRNRKT